MLHKKTSPQSIHCISYDMYPHINGYSAAKEHNKNIKKAVRLNNRTAFFNNQYIIIYRIFD